MSLRKASGERIGLGTDSVIGTDYEQIMNENGERLRDLMVSKGYPEDFARIIAGQMQTDYTSKRMCDWINRAGFLPAEEVADEMLSILAERDRMVEKHIAMHAQKKINHLYMSGLKAYASCDDEQ